MIGNRSFGNILPLNLWKETPTDSPWNPSPNIHTQVPENPLVSPDLIPDSPPYTGPSPLWPSWQGFPSAGFSPHKALQKPP